MTAHRHALYFVHALTPLHVGADQGLGAIDLPTLREAHTGWPLVPGSSIKGVLREQAEHHFKGNPAPTPSDKAQRADWDKKNRECERQVEGIFGPPTERAGDFRGGVVFGDAYPLLLPVRSLAGTFAWVTCSQVLRRLQRDAKEAYPGKAFAWPDAPPDDNRVLIATAEGQGGNGRNRNQNRGTSANAHAIVIALNGHKHVLFEDLCLEATPTPSVTSLGNQIADWIWPNETRDQPQSERDFLRQRLAVVPDDVFNYFCRHRLEIRARVSIDSKTGIVDNGPWTEELIPAETILCGILQARGTSIRERKQDDIDAGRDVKSLGEGIMRAPDDLFTDLREFVNMPRTLRVGGHASVGLGRARVTMTPKPEATKGPQS